MRKLSHTSLAAVLLLAACTGTTRTPVAAGPAAGQPTIPMNLPLKYDARPTVAAITPADLMSRLYVFADDSMGGRAAGSAFNDKGTAYIAAEVKRLGLMPAGDNGTYFQSARLFNRALDSTSTITVNGTTYRAGVDFIATVPNQPVQIGGAQVMYAGFNLDTMNIPQPAQVAGKVLVIGPLMPGFKAPQNQEQLNAILNSRGYKEFQAMIQAAAAIVMVSPSAFTPAQVTSSLRPSGWNATRVPLKGDKPTPITLTVTSAVAEALLGGPAANATKGAAGASTTFSIRHRDTPVPGRNVVAMLPGSDARLKNEYVVVGAHNDHVPPSTVVDHDSLRAFNTVVRPGGAESPMRAATAEEKVRINAIKDSLRARNGGMRPDSIHNGADDDGSGSMAVLEIAEAFALARTKPKRSMLFVWHTGEELGMFGSNYFTDHPTVPRESIVAALNVDMIGRGNEMDSPGVGGPQYLQLLGSRRLSKQYGDLVEQVIRETNSGFVPDYSFDADGHPQRFYCRSDHWAYARYGIPVTFFSTGGHRDYHMRTDEPQYIDYPKFTRVTQLIHDVAVRTANLDSRLVVDGKVGDPHGECVQ